MDERIRSEGDSFDRQLDVVVVGGGPAGSAAALSLACAGCSVAVLERSDYSKARVGETLPPAVKVPLARLGLWNTFLGQSPASSPAIHSAWGSGTLRVQNHLYNPYGGGWHIDRRRFDLMLACGAQDAGARLITGCQIISCECDDSCRWTIGFRTRKTTSSLMRACIVLDATGRSSAIARYFGVRRTLYDNLVGIVGFFTPVNKRDVLPITLVEAVENGWWYSAPLPDSRLAVAWMTDADLYARGVRHSTRKWLEQLGRTVHTRERTERAALVSPPLIMQANSSRLDQIHGRAWLAVGDAAIAFDPITGQGVYQGLESGMRAAAAVQAFLGGQPAELSSYAERLVDAFSQFLDLRSKYYGLEQRWATSNFWQRRQISFRHSVSGA